MLIVEIPDMLRQVEFTDVAFVLEFQEPLTLQSGDLLRLRRELRQAAAFVFAGDQKGREANSALFDPPVSADPVLRKQVQKPGPGFVIRGQVPEARAFDVGDTLMLNVLFWGRAVQFLPCFARLLQGLGGNGLVAGRGMFELVAVEAADAGGQRQPLWLDGDDVDSLSPPILDAAWWLEGRLQGTAQSSMRLSFLSPARLLSANRPLFRPRMTTIFPFLLRRVTSMVQAHCGIELVSDPQALLTASQQLRQEYSSLHWQDWRRLESQEGHQDLGGVSGSVLLSGPSLSDIAWILHLGSLMQVGKGAAYGAGRYDLHPAP